MHWSINPPPLKTPPPSFLPIPLLKLANCPSPLFRQSPPLYWFFVNPCPPPPKSQITQWTPKLPASLDLWQLYQLMLFRFFWICPIGFFQINFGNLPTTLLMKAPNVMLNTEIQTLKVIRGIHQKSFVSWFQMIQNTFSGINNKTQLYC